MQKSSILLLMSLLLLKTGLSIPFFDMDKRAPRGGGGGSSSGGGGSSSSSTSSNGSSTSIKSWFSKHKALIIGVGVAVLVIITLLIGVRCWRRRKNRRSIIVTQTQEPHKGYMPPEQ